MLRSTRSLVSRTFTVEHLMTPRSQFTTWDMDESQGELPDFSKLEFDVTPVLQGGEITNVLVKITGKCESISYRWLISSDTSIPELLDYFVEYEQPAYLILQRREIVGIVSPADLNKLPARAYVYHLVGELEMSLAELIRTDYSDNREMILGHLNGERIEEVLSFEQELKSGNAEVDILQFLNLAELISIIQKGKMLRRKLCFTSRNQAEDQFSGINELRNRTMHPVHPLLNRVPDDLKTLQGRISRTIDVLERLSQTSSQE